MLGDKESVFQINGNAPHACVGIGFGGVGSAFLETLARRKDRKVSQVGRWQQLSEELANKS